MHERDAQILGTLRGEGGRFITQEDRNQMRDIHERLTSEVTRARSDKRYSDTGRRNAIAAAHQRATRSAQKLRDAFDADINTKRAALERKLNSHGGDVASLRDAWRYVDAIQDGKDAERQLRRALAAGDTVLATAIVNRAATSPGWQPVLDLAAKDLPDVAEQVKELAALPHEKAQNTLGNMTFGIRRHGLDELGTANDSQIAQWAAEDIPLPAEPQTSNIGHVGVGAIAPAGSTVFLG